MVASCATSDAPTQSVEGGKVARVTLLLFVGIVTTAVWSGKVLPSPVSITSVHELHPQALYEAELPPVNEEYYSWTWQDSGKSMFGHDIAEYDPLRWSDWLSAQGMVTELKEYISPHNIARKVQTIKKHSGDTVNVGGNNGKSTVFPNVGAAIKHFHRLAMAGKSHQQENLRDKRSNRSIFHLLLAMATGSATTFIVGYIIFCCYKSRKPAKQPSSLLGDSSDDEEAPATTGKVKSEPFDRTELDRLLDDIGESGPTLALPSTAQGETTTRSAKLAAEAAKEVERVLAARDVQDIFCGSLSQHRSEYRRLVRLLHPDKGILSGERAALALRRVVEAHNTLENTGR